VQPVGKESKEDDSDVESRLTVQLKTVSFQIREINRKMDEKFERQS